MNFRAPILACLRWSTLALVLCSYSSQVDGFESHILYVAVEDVTDIGLKQKIAEFGGEEVQRIVIAMGTPGNFPEATFHLTANSTGSANDAALCAAMERADVIVLRGGTFMLWQETVYPPGKVTLVSGALQRVFSNRKPVVAYGGACAFLSGGVLVNWDELPESSRDPRPPFPWEPRVAVDVGPRCLFEPDGGLLGTGPSPDDAFLDKMLSQIAGGNFPRDQTEDPEESPEPVSLASPLRLLQAMNESLVELGVYLRGEVALDFDRYQNRVTVLGPGSILLFDLGPGPTENNAVSDGRISLLFDGDHFNIAEKRAFAGAEKEMVLGQPRVWFASWTSPFSAPGPPARYLAARITSGWMLHRDEEFLKSTWNIGWDSRSRRHVHATKFRDLTHLRLPFTCRWTRD